MSKKTYERIALSTLVLPALGAYALGRPFAGWLSSLEDEPSALLSLLGYVLALLACVLVWGVALLPLRRRAGITPITEELKQLRDGGFAEAYEKERAAIAEREKSDDPAVRAEHHLTFALVGALLSAGSLLLTWALWQDGWVLILPLGFALVGPPLTLYHLARGIRFRRRAPR